VAQAIRELLASYLKEAHALEQQSLQMLELAGGRERLECAGAAAEEGWCTSSP